MWDKILALFGKKQVSDSNNIQNNQEYVANYEDNTDINFNAIFANKLANYTMSDSSIDIKGDNARAKLLKQVIKRLKKQMKKFVSRDLGTGGALIVPYVTSGKIYFNIVSQSRLIINKKLGDDIVDCTIMAEHLIKDKQHYFRWADYTLENGNIYIKYRATLEDTAIDMKTIKEWQNIEDIAISNVDRMLFMYVKSPIDNRKENNDYGVPITYGCQKQIEKIMHTLDQITREFDLKEVFIGADATMFKDNGNGALPTNGIYRKINAGDEEFWEVFDPAFRDSPLFNKLANECAMLEKQIGTSKGIITEVETNNATATEIKKMLKDTFDLVDDIRDSLEEGLDNFIYACNVLANYYKLSPQGEYELITDWSYDLLEDTQQTFNQLLQGESRGVIRKVEIRQFLRPDETIEESQKAIDEIKEENPTTKDLLGD